MSSESPRQDTLIKGSFFFVVVVVAQTEIPLPLASARVGGYLGYLIAPWPRQRIQHPAAHLILVLFVFWMLGHSSSALVRSAATTPHVLLSIPSGRQRP